MPKVKNLKKKGVPLLRHRILPDGRVQDPHGHVHDLLPPELAQTAQALRLVKEGYIEIEGLQFTSQVVEVKPGEPVKVTLRDEVKTDDKVMTSAKPDDKKQGGKKRGK
jgi:hypothetical protein